MALLAIPPLALALGLLARSQIARSGEDGWAWATAAVWISAVTLGFWLLALAAAAAIVTGLVAVSVLGA